MAEPMDVAPTKINSGTAAIPAAISTHPNTAPMMEPRYHGATSRFCRS
jgi:hypothetical protein